MQDLSIAVIQPDIHWQNPAANRDMYELYIRAIEHVDLIILPEACTSSFSPNNPDIAEPMDGTSVTWLRKLAQDQKVMIGGSFCIKENGKLYNRFIWAFPDGEIQHYDKRHLFTFAGEHKRYQRGADEPLIVEYKGWRIRCAVCYELRFPAWMRNQQNYDLMVVVANWPSARDYAWRNLNRARAIENIAYHASCNRVGNDGQGLHYAGGSAILDFQGHSLAEAKPQSAEVIKTTLSAEKLIQFREHFPALDDMDDYKIDL